MRRRTTVIVVLVLLAGAGPLAAQQAARLLPEVRVRVTLTDPAASALRGTLQLRTDSTLTIAAAAGPRVIAYDRIARLEVSRGRKPNVVAGIVGFGVGALAGGAIGCAANADSYGVFCGGQNDTKVVLSAVAGGLVGGALGAWLFRREDWVEADLTTVQPADR